MREDKTLIGAQERIELPFVKIPYLSEAINQNSYFLQNLLRACVSRKFNLEDSSLFTHYAEMASFLDWIRENPEEVFAYVEPRRERRQVRQRVNLYVMDSEIMPFSTALTYTPGAYSVFDMYRYLHEEGDRPVLGISLQKINERSSRRQSQLAREGAISARLTFDESGRPNRSAIPTMVANVDQYNHLAKAVGAAQRQLWQM